MQAEFKRFCVSIASTMQIVQKYRLLTKTAMSLIAEKASFVHFQVLVVFGGALLLYIQCSFLIQCQASQFPKTLI